MSALNELIVDENNIAFHPMMGNSYQLNEISKDKRQYMSDDFNKLKSILLKSEIDKIDNITKELSSLKNQQQRDILVENLSQTNHSLA